MGISSTYNCPCFGRTSRNSSFVSAISEVLDTVLSWKFSWSFFPRSFRYPTRYYEDDWQVLTQTYRRKDASLPWWLNCCPGQLWVWAKGVTSAYSSFASLERESQAQTALPFCCFKICDSGRFIHFKRFERERLVIDPPPFFSPLALVAQVPHLI